MSANQKTLKEVIDENFKGLKFSGKDIKDAGRKLKAFGVDEAVKYLSDKGSTEAPPNLKAPIKCNIVAKSRDFTEWPIFKASKEIQEYIYSLPYEEMLKSKPEKLDAITRKEFLKNSGVNTFGYTHSQGLNYIIKNAYNTYNGVIKKVENKNLKNEKKIKDINKIKKENGEDEIVHNLETAFNENNCLLHPPGINKTIQAYQNTVSPFSNQIELPEKFLDYNKKPDDLIPILIPENRLDIPKGMPGHIANKEHRDNLSIHNKTKRMKKHWKNSKEWAKHSLLALIKIGDDWALVDLRGLLRNVTWRQKKRIINAPSREDLTINKLLDLVTGDPIIDIERNIVQFSYKENVLGIRSKKSTIKGKKTKEVLEELAGKSSVGVVSIDLGQTNPVAASIYRVNLDNNNLKTKKLNSFFLPEHLLIGLKKYREEYDRVTLSVKYKSISKLPDDMQNEINLVYRNDNLTDLVKGKICKNFNIKEDQLDWGKMSNNTYYITEFLLENKITDDVYVGKTKKIKKNDFKWFSEFKPKLSEETSSAWREKQWELQRNLSDYQKLTQRKNDLIKNIVNYVINETKKHTQCDVVIPIIEKLDCQSKFFDGKGKREPGWDNFTNPKKENRWFIKLLKKSFIELAKNRGMYVFEVNPNYTSQTCPECNFQDRKNRNGEKFECLNCKKIFHADLEVATHNLLKVAVSGQALKQTKCERRGAAKKPGTARNKLKSLKRKEKIAIKNTE